MALKLFRGVRRTPPCPPAESDAPLTPRHEEILALLGEGRTDGEIAALLTLKKGTVRFHIHSILQRLQLENRAQAAAYAHTRRSTLANQCH